MMPVTGWDQTAEGETEMQPLSERVALNLVRLRNERDLTQDELAAKLGWIRQKLSHKETGRSVIALDELVELEAALGAHRDEFFAPIEGTLTRQRPTRLEEWACQRISTVRDDQGLSQAELADRLGVHPSWVSARETGRTPLDPVSLHHIAVALGFADMSALLDVDPAASEKDGKLVRAIRGIDLPRLARFRRHVPDGDWAEVIDQRLWSDPSSHERRRSSDRDVVVGIVRQHTRRSA